MSVVRRSFYANAFQPSYRTGEVSRAAVDLSRRNESQAATVEQTAAALHQITKGTKATAALTAGASEVADKAKKAAETGGKVGRSAVLKMKKIENSSQQIAKFVAIMAPVETFKMPGGGHDSNGALCQADRNYAKAGSTGKSAYAIPSRGQVVAKGNGSAAADAGVSN